MELENLKCQWESFGAQKAEWAVLTSKDNWNIDEFFATGINDISRLKREFKFLNRDLGKLSGNALDFGCGLGRITYGLGKTLNFKHIVGVDISKSMVDKAIQYNAFPNRCEYFVNISKKLPKFKSETFDFICSFLCLQHIHPEIVYGYIKEFARLLRSGGMMFFNLPALDICEKYKLYQERIKADKEVIRADVAQLVRLKITNSGEAIWYKDEPINIANSWYTGIDKYELLIKDDKRIGLSHDVYPGESIEIDFMLDSVPKNARYISFDLVYENKFWFGENGNQANVLYIPVLPVDVLPMKTESYDVIGENYGKLFNTVINGIDGMKSNMEVWGIEPKIIEDILLNEGCRVIHMAQSDEITPPVLGYRYYVEKI